MPNNSLSVSPEQVITLLKESQKIKKITRSKYPFDYGYILEQAIWISEEVNNSS